jgi:hypothetical protein
MYLISLSMLSVLSKALPDFLGVEDMVDEALELLEPDEVR